jgi:hypothetical protein
VSVKIVKDICIKIFSIQRKDLENKRSKNIGKEMSSMWNENIRYDKDRHCGGKKYQKT